MAAPLPWQVSHSASFGTSISTVLAEHRLVQLQLDLIAQVRAAKHLRAAAAGAPPPKMSPNTSPKMSLKASGAAKPRATAARGGLDAGVTVLIVDRALAANRASTS